MSVYAGFDDNDVFFCPANKKKKATDARFWQFSWLGSGASPAGGGPFPNEVALMDEDGLRPDQQRGYYRVPPYLYMFDKYDAQGVSIFKLKQRCRYKEDLNR